MTKNKLLGLILNHPKTDRDDKSLAKKLAKSRKHVTPKLALLNMARRVTKSRIAI